ncbi:MAG TPA: 4-hydroxy-tetrahydrodipicolinate reductase, partial [Chthoniobacterales bacterium]|nr:4-hydroxy-tetrahydrodipicolinate reductase [Chthoniobacterales bacterium]
LDGVSITATVDAGDSIETGLKVCDVAIDFSAAGAIGEIVDLAVKQSRPLVIGTTGHSSDQTEIIRSSAEKIPVVLASNFSVGVNVLFWLTGRAASLLGNRFAPEIVEVHHVMKKDAPSGTAKTLAEILKNETGRAEVPTRSIREGDIVGEHTVIFDGPGERLELMHRAQSRETFATGALAAAQWVMKKPPGLYSMQDVLGLD